MSHPDQVHPDIVVWRDLVEDPPSSIKPFFPRKVKVLTAAKKDLPAKIPPAPKLEILPRRYFPPPHYAPDPGKPVPSSDLPPIQLAPPPPVLTAVEEGQAYGTHSCRGDALNAGTTIYAFRMVKPRMGISHITTGPLPLVIFTIGKPKRLTSQKTLRN